MQLLKLALPLAFVATFISAAALPISHDLFLESQSRDVQNEPMSLDRRIIINGKDMEYKPIRKPAATFLKWLTSTYRKKNGRRDAYDDFDLHAFINSLPQSRPQSRDVDEDLFFSLFEERDDERSFLDRRIIINGKDMEYKPIRKPAAVFLKWLTSAYRKKNGRRDVSDEDAFLASLLESRDVDEDLLASLFEERDDEDSLERRVIVNGKDYGVTPLGRAGRIWKFLGRVISGIGGRDLNSDEAFFDELIESRGFQDDLLSSLSD